MEDTKISRYWTILKIPVDGNLSLVERYVYGLILSLSKKKPCTASNHQLSEYMCGDPSPDGVRKILARLEEKEYIRIDGKRGSFRRTIRPLVPFNSDRFPGINSAMARLRRKISDDSTSPPSPPTSENLPSTSPPSPISSPSRPRSSPPEDMNYYNSNIDYNKASSDDKNAIKKYDVLEYLMQYHSEDLSLGEYSEEGIRLTSEWMQNVMDKEGINEGRIFVMFKQNYRDSIEPAW
jgi:hypothetical protein